MGERGHRMGWCSPRAKEKAPTLPESWVSSCWMSCRPCGLSNLPSGELESGGSEAACGGPPAPAMAH